MMSGISRLYRLEHRMQVASKLCKEKQQLWLRLLICIGLVFVILCSLFLVIMKLIYRHFVLFFRGG